MGLAVMSLSFRITSLLFAAVTVAAGLTAAPTIAADGTLGRPPEPVAVSGAESWGLRPTRVAVAATLARRPEKVIALSDLPEERRMVRIVYQGYSPVSPPR